MTATGKYEVISKITNTYTSFYQQNERK